MHLEKIISLANARVRLRFLAMERSLRACGCDLPLHVIPYDDTRFDLPKNASWCSSPALFTELARNKSHATMRKYHCLLESNYQFVDSDVVFLKNPQTALAPHAGFITSCGHWHNPEQTYTEESVRFFRERSTTWQMGIFNTGQFACDRILYTEQSLIETIHRTDVTDTCLRFKFHEQPGVNLLVHLAKHPIVNLTLPPTCMESTWAGDYSGSYDSYWKDEARKPYLVHWAGCRMNMNRPIDRLFLDYLTGAERREWEEEVRLGALAAANARKSFRSVLRNFKNGFRAFREAFHRP